MTEQTEHTTSQPDGGHEHAPAGGIGVATDSSTPAVAVQDDVSGYSTASTFPTGGSLLPTFGVGVQYCRPPESEGVKANVPREPIADRSFKGG